VDIYLVSCVKTKRRGRHPARDLYVSPWFKKAKSYVEKKGAQWFILSAKHHLVHPDQEIRSYEQGLADMSVKQRRAWAERVLTALRPLVGARDTVHFLAGAVYREFLEGPIRQMGCRVKVPMNGLPFGEQLRWLSR